MASTFHGVGVPDRSSISPGSLELLRSTRLRVSQKRCSKLACRCLADCVSDEAKLEEFLETADMWNDLIITNIPWFAVAVKILGQNFTAIRKQAVSQKLLEQVPKLALDLLSLVAEEKENDELEEKTSRKECKKNNRRRLAVSELQQRDGVGL
jgi:hypothetical protein